MTADPADAQRSPAWSPDGRLIAFTSNHEVGTDGRYAYQLYTVRADGTRIVRRTSAGTAKENPAWIVRR
jgi:Tol biopolymer transport system component